MIPTYTHSIKKSILDEHLSFNLVGILIYKPSLGITNSPSNEELQARESLTMTEVINAELGGINLNGYARAIVNLSPSILVNGSYVSSKEIEFIPSDGIMGPFTHVVLVRGANLVGASSINGNNRGNNVGNVVLAEPVVGAPLLIEAPVSFKYTINFNLAIKSL